MLTFMNSKLRWLAKTSKTTFSKKVNPMKYSVLIYIIHSISCVLLTEKLNERCQNSQKFERNAISTTKKSF